MHPRSGCGPCRPCHKAEPWQEQFPFTHFPSPGNIPRFGSRHSQGAVGWRSVGQEALQSPAGIHREVSCSCSWDGGDFSPQEMNLSLGKMQEDAPFICSLTAAAVELQGAQTPLCSHPSTAPRAAQGDLTWNNFHWLITGQNFTLN